MEDMGMQFGMSWGYWAAMFLMGGTNIWTIVMYVLEKKKRKIELDGSVADVNQKEFDTVKDQFEVFDKRLENYSTDLLAAENTIRELREKNDELQKDRIRMGFQVFKLQQLVGQKDEEINTLNARIDHLRTVVCVDSACPNRKNENKKQL